eukprot:PhF_6_TR15495/c0_g1_i1/m.24109
MLCLILVVTGLASLVDSHNIPSPLWTTQTISTCSNYKLTHAIALLEGKYVLQKECDVIVLNTSSGVIINQISSTNEGGFGAPLRLRQQKDDIGQAVEILSTPTPFSNVSFILTIQSQSNIVVNVSAATLVLSPSGCSLCGLDNDTVIVTNAGNSLVAVNPINGRVKWNWSPSNYVRTPSFKGEVPRLQTPSTSRTIVGTNGVVYSIGCEDSNLTVAYNPLTNKALWTFEMKNSVAIVALQETTQTLIIQTYNNHVVGLNISNGYPKWDSGASYEVVSLGENTNSLLVVNTSFVGVMESTTGAMMWEILGEHVLSALWVMPKSKSKPKVLVASLRNTRLLVLTLRGEDHGDDIVKQHWDTYEELDGAIKSVTMFVEGEIVTVSIAVGKSNSVIRCYNVSADLTLVWSFVVPTEIVSLQKETDVLFLYGVDDIVRGYNVSALRPELQPEEHKSEWWEVLIIGTVGVLILIGIGQIANRYRGKIRLHFMEPDSSTSPFGPTSSQQEDDDSRRE